MNKELRKKFIGLSKELDNELDIMLSNGIWAAIDKTCLDKQRVKEVLDGMCLNHDIHPCETISQIKIELGLK